MVEDGPKDLVHQCLERRGHVGQAEGHYDELEVSMMRVEHCLVDVRRLHADLSEEGAPLELVAHSLGVEGAIVDAETPARVLA